MAMHKPPHPGEFIQATYMEPFNLSCRYLAKQLDVAPSTLSRVLKMQSGISPEMALRLSKSLGRSPESWLDGVLVSIKLNLMRHNEAISSSAKKLCSTQASKQRC